jgi:hypothetical protein
MNQWIWEGQLTNFSDFTNWNGIEGVGCAPACIYAKNRLYMKYPSGKWVATVSTTLLPYVCASDCALGYVWRRESRKCVKVVSEAKVAFTEAEVSCSRENGQLARVSICHDFYALGRDLWWVSQNVSNTYWIGYYDTGRQWKINCVALKLFCWTEKILPSWKK